MSFARIASRFGRVGVGGLRILGYHGVCRDEVARQPWVPDYFVTASAFERQMEYLSRRFRVVRLADVYETIRSNPAALNGCVAVTFDDVAACVMDTAVPVLDQFGFSASFFVSTGHASSGRLFDDDVLRLIRCDAHLAGPHLSASLSGLVDDARRFKTMSISDLRRVLDGPGKRLMNAIDESVYETLRPVNSCEVRRLFDAGHEIGAHTTDHAILCRQGAAERRAQIVESIADVERMVGVCPVGFAYPNGGPGDFDAIDQAILEYCGIGYAVSTRSDVCDREATMFDLPRTCIGMGHTPLSFGLELTGILDRRRRRQQGWT